MKPTMLAAAAFIALPALAFANTIVVSPTTPNGWVFSNTDNSGTNASGAFVNGPGTPPLGIGSAQFTVGDALSSEILYSLTTPYQGQAVGTLTGFSYDYYRGSPVGTGSVLEPSLQLAIYSPTGTYEGRLVYEPYLAGLATADTTWALANTNLGSGWWASHSSTTCSQSSTCSWATISADYANDVVGAILFKAGSGWASFQGNVDDLTISSSGAAGDTTYNFEPAVPEPASFAVLGAGLLGLLMVRKRRVHA